MGADLFHGEQGEQQERGKQGSDKGGGTHALRFGVTKQAKGRQSVQRDRESGH